MDFMSFLSTEDMPVIEDIEIDTRSERIAQCGHTWGGMFEPQHGKWRPVPFKCGVWRECPRCLEDRVVTERTKMEVAAENEIIRYVELPEAEADALCQELGKANLRRYPGKEVDYIFFLDDGIMRGQEVTPEFLAELDWASIVMTPQGRKLSGSLGRIQCLAEASSAPKIKVECIMSDADADLRKVAVIHAIDATSTLRPTTIEALKQALEARTYSYKAFLLSHGAKLYPSHHAVESINLSELDWGLGGYWTGKGEVK